MKKIWNKVNRFLSDYISDVFLILGAMLVIIATTIMFGFTIALFLLGGFLMLAGIVGRFFEQGGENK
ncbi:hypothetical protein Q5O89_16835 [Peribacillus frigoritolerans]|nr:hypothetical protein [Peribacillus frigoritolerans]